MNENIKKDNDSKKIFTLVIMIFTLMICTTGATYAYFAITTPTNTSMTGTTATANLSLDVTRLAPTSAKWTSSTQKMVPQFEKVGGNGVELLTTAMNTTNSCVDGNGNVICQVYEIKLTNGGTSNLSVTGNLVFSWTSPSTFANLKYRLKANETVALNETTAVANTNLGGATSATIASGTPISLATQKSLAVNTSYYWYIVFWINETGESQNATDTGTFTSAVTFNPVNPTTGETMQGITSTITAAS